MLLSKRIMNRVVYKAYKHSSKGKLGNTHRVKLKKKFRSHNKDFSIRNEKNELFLRETE